MSNSPTPPPFPQDEPLDGIGRQIRVLLRQPEVFWRNIASGNPAGLMRGLLLIVIGGSLLYGLVVGSFSGGVQWWSAPLKIGAGLVLSMLICLPSLYVFSCLSGINARVQDVATVLCSMGALIVILLASFGPVAWVFSQSTGSVATMGFLHLLFWIVAAGFGVRLLTKAFRTMGANTVGVFAVWSAIFLLVSMQMMTSLRPIVGTSHRLLTGEKKFFLQHWVETIDTPSSTK